MKFKYCLIGCGMMANMQHGPALKRYEALHDGVEFAACCDLVEEKAKLFQQSFQIPRCYTNIDTMLKAEKPDAVCLLAPVDSTAELSCHILAQGYPLIMEKPPGKNSAETMRIINAAQATNTPNQVAFNRRYMPLVQKLKDFLDELGGANCITDIQYRMLRVNRQDADFSTTAIHGIDLVRHIAGSDYKEISFHYQRREWWESSAFNIHMDCEMESGALVHLDFLPMSGAVAERLDINTDKGLLTVNLPVLKGIDGEGGLLYCVENRQALSLGGRDVAGSDENYITSGFYNENARFLDDIRSGISPEGDAASGLQSVEVANSVRLQSARYTRKK